MASVLVVVPCGRQKIWASNFLAGPTPAKDAYVYRPRHSSALIPKPLSPWQCHAVVLLTERR